MHAPLQFLFDGLQLYPHAIPSGLPFDLEFTPARFAADEGVSRPGIFTSGLSQNRARDSRLTRLPSGKHTGHTEPPVHEEMRALPCQLL